MTSRWPAALILATMVPAGLAGCAEAPAVGPAEPGGLPPPVEPSPSRDLARQWYYGWVDEADVVAGGPVGDMILILSMGGRDWRYPVGPDGYAVRVVLLDRTDRSAKAAGTLSAFLVRSPDQKTSEALHAWPLDQKQTERRYREGLVSGYLLQLDWGTKALTRAGTFMLVVRWTSKNGRHRLTRNIIFQDTTHGRRRQPTTRP